MKLVCLLLLAACASSTAPPESEGDGTGDDAPPPPDAARPPDFLDANHSFVCDPADGPAAALLIDDHVHPGGVWNEAMDFHMDAYPVTWAMATVHASLLLRRQCIDLSPSAVLSMALKESRLTCGQPGSLANGDGCFQIESTSAY